ncbi:MAG TPA: histidine kinase, partial [Flavitalea sp.]|nr:histidine kinase [Flavitalea sp.]
LFTHNGIGLVNVFSRGVYFITRQNKIMKAPPELDIVDKGSYTYFFEDREGWIWVSNAGKGLIHFRIDENTYQVRDLTVLTTEQGLPANKISGLEFDLEGGTWVCCSNGLVVLKHNPANRNVWDVYPIGKEQNIQLSTPTTFARDRSGNMWLASLDQLKMIHTSELVLKKVVPKVVIEKVLLDMKETNWRNYSDSVKGYSLLPVDLKLKHYQNTLGIEFTGISLYNADYFEYSYQLEPSEKTWSAPSSNKLISLVNLAPGKYLFKVKARGMGTGWSEPQVFSFTIDSPFWDTWWFLSLIFVLAAAIVISIYRNRVKKIQKEANLQSQLREMEMKALRAQMNPHFIYNALNSIQSLIADERKSEAINYIGTFSRLLRQVLEYSETNVITLDKELQTLNLYIQLESLRLNMDLEYNVSTDHELLPENEKIPPLILQPFIENALWHGLSRKNGRKQLSIIISQEDNYLTCAVEDNGIGRANAMAYKKKSTVESYTSRGTDITIRRLIDFNRIKESPVVYHDLVDIQGQAAGTRVIINIKRHSLMPGLPDSN